MSCTLFMNNIDQIVECTLFPWGRVPGQEVSYHIPVGEGNARSLVPFAVGEGNARSLVPYSCGGG